ncbi:MAG: hypothetical protein ACXVZ2_01590 [Gaiellaceae bacterium]
MSERLLLFYPRRWRERYGQELLAVVEAASAGGRVPLRVRLDVIRAGLSQRLRSSGLIGDEVPPEARSKAGLGLVLWAWALFVLAGTCLQKLSEHWRLVTPNAGRAVPAAAFDGVVVAAAIGSAFVVLGVALVARPLLAFLRSGGWRRARPAVLLSVLAAAALVAVVAWAHHLTVAQRNGGDRLYEGAFLLLAACAVASLVAWTHLGATTATRLSLVPGTLRLEAYIAAVVTWTMAAMTGATTIWWASVPGAAAPGSEMIVVALAMLLATGLAGAGTARALRETA